MSETSLYFVAQLGDATPEVEARLVQWGKGDGPYARLREGGGEGDSRYGAAAGATTTALTEEERVEARDALLAEVDEVERDSVDSTLDSLIQSIFLESRNSVCSNGVLLERQ